MSINIDKAEKKERYLCAQELPVTYAKKLLGPDAVDISKKR
jgi:hypothetical protein